MQPFPYRAPGFTFRQFAEALFSAGLSVARIEDPNGNGTECLYRFVNIKAPDFAEVIEYVADDSWPMMASTFRSLCVRIGIDPDIITPRH